MSEELNQVKRHPYRVAFGSRDLGILAEMPEIRIVHRRHDWRLYDREGGDEAASEIVETSATVTFASCDIATALELVASFAVGDDVLDTGRARELRLSPPAESGEKTLSFPRAVLLPELEYTPKSDRHRAKLTFRARPDDNGTLYTFA